ncbi:hypothetical protein COS31_02335 [Candidatus Roizmanbacteria bacterium CG02_land_8_20_14_3_00_36_15]|uniref:Glycosyltransferase 2-like domain-containing protein n=2 Tax=Candidatus Roizmaniibacteriota TaxID=1752723 RepID=A0A2M8KLS1_9BACT|nr:MAG: hypothetical protein COS51_03020 [Candidatus Roizmanbacteria bacterium CG03_land_8_20_14_0_80_36_21]PIV37904.1 MAG: hypothetical protein COS31_02335 [Candidatus Roizmanbacteria bacterium CG02_land_8_20_14_3_00_36_15]PIY69874.1 MAG: hypothetical protein COY89_04045 [Candidatus Roizmanbacteria bacterium CG_4_10_14_0_8_um_filter_36_36]PJA53880.1 MAG: hypothetical protein CO166_00090 [Candidatus Roizmanbacteria bacterium CG_4_9_14_3_um_filter_36_11]PJC81712.1 MAG: hypothetical protein CO007
MAKRLAKSVRPASFVSKIFDRLLETIIPICAWATITLPLWMSPFHPAVVAYFIIAFDLYFFYKSAQTAFFATISYKKILETAKINFFKKMLSLKKMSIIKHFIIIPSYQEPLYKLEVTLKMITQNDYPSKKIFLVLALEERENNIHQKAQVLYKKFHRYFADIIISYHKLQPNELAGKASNQTVAALLLDQYVKKKHWQRKNVLITICDADSHLPSNYFSYLTYQYLKDKNKIYHFYWAPVLLYNNFWQLPLFVRIQATLSSIVRLAFLSYREKLIQISTYSTNLWLLKKINFWDVDIIPEDWHIYLQAFFTFGEKIRTIPLFTIINGDAVFSGHIMKTLVNRYEQEKRWAWGVTDVAYSLKKFFITPHIRSLTKIKKILFVVETHLLWPVSFFILTISASIPPLINPVFKRTVLGFLLPKLSALILTLSTVMLFLYVFFDIKLRQKVKQNTSFFSLPILIIQWYFLPLVSFLLSSLPALEAHTRILLGKKLKYKVTEKV